MKKSCEELADGRNLCVVLLRGTPSQWSLLLCQQHGSQCPDSCPGATPPHPHVPLRSDVSHSSGWRQDARLGSHAIKTLSLPFGGKSELGIVSSGNRLNERAMVVALDIVEVRENPGGSTTHSWGCECLVEKSFRA